MLGNMVRHELGIRNMLYYRDCLTGLQLIRHWNCSLLQMHIKINVVELTTAL
jgi:hypothetical protein